MVSSDRLKPSEQGSLVATIDTRGRIGEMNKSIQINTNDPARPSIVLYLKITVKPKAANR